MKASVLQRKILPALVLLTSLLALQWAWAPESSGVQRQQQQEKINLALRQAAHRLLVQAGDSASAIPPVRQVLENEFQLRFEQHFNYDSLPSFLEAAFQGHGIDEDYNVAVKNCEAENLLMLGYTKTDFTEKKEVPCKGREQAAGCQQLSVIFPGWPAGASGPEHWRRWLLGGGTLLSLAYLLYTFFVFVKNSGETTATTEAAAPENPGETLQFGNTIFEITNQAVLIGGRRQTLTFREAKLLSLFCKNINQLLDRSQLLEEVWGDEGVIVGRSLDVFVSRLRKILKADPSIKIVNVHSVGYRLEVGKNDK